MLTKMCKISRIINTLVFVLRFVLIIIAGVYWWKKKYRKRLSASAYFSNADITDLTGKELKELNDERDIMI